MASQETVWFNGQPVATVRAGILYYINADHLSTPRSIVRASDNLEVWRWDSDPFGTNNPVLSTVVYFPYNLRFPGQYKDTETGLHYNGMRDYDPRTGRYLQADPIGLAGGKNRYGYVKADPLKKIDPLGLAASKSCSSSWSSCMNTCISATNPWWTTPTGAAVSVAGAAAQSQLDNVALWTAGALAAARACAKVTTVVSVATAGYALGSSGGCALVCTVDPCYYDGY
jgi:RHS repeat-associated protein